MTRMLIAIHLMTMFCFSVVAGASISYAADRRAQDIASRAMMAALMSLSLKELGDVRVRQL